MKHTCKALFITALLIMGATLHAQQPLSLSVRGGMNLSNIDNDDVDADVKVSYQFGFITDFALPNNLFLQSGLLLTNKGAKSKWSGIEDIDGNGYLDEGTIKETLNTRYLQMPIHLGYKIHVMPDFRVNFTAGTYLAYGIGGKMKTEYDLYMDFDPYVPVGLEHIIRTEKANSFGKNGLKRFDMGLSGGVGAEYKKFTLHIGYEYGFINIGRGKLDTFNRNAFVALGYRIF